MAMRKDACSTIAADLETLLVILSILPSAAAVRRAGPSVYCLQEHPPSPAELQAAAEGLTTDPARLHSLSAELSTVAIGTGQPHHSHTFMLKPDSSPLSQI